MHISFGLWANYIVNIHSDVGLLIITATHKGISKAFILKVGLPSKGAMLQVAC